MPAKANTTVVHRNRDAMKNIPGGCITIHFVEVRTAAINMRISAGLTRDDKSERPSRKQTLVGDTRHAKPVRRGQISEYNLARVRVIGVPRATRSSNLHINSVDYAKIANATSHVESGQGYVFLNISASNTS